MIASLDFDRSLGTTSSNVEFILQSKLDALTAQMEQLMNHTPAVLYRLKLEGKNVTPITASENIESMLGFTVAEAMDPIWWFQHLHPEDRDRVIGDNVGTSRFEYRMRHKNGSYRWVDDNRKLIYNAFGVPVELVGIWLDITARKLADEVLETSERRLRLATRAGGLGVFEHTVHDDRISISAKFCQILGWPPRASISHDEWLARLHPDDDETTRIGINRFQKEQVPFDLEYRIVRPDGNVRWIRAMAIPVVKQGEVCCIHGVIQDITERKLAESELRKLSRAVEQSPVSIVITDLQGRIEYVNPKFCALTGYSFEEVRGENPRVLKSGETPDEAYRQMWEALVAGNAWQGEFHNRKKNGELYWELASISPIRDDAGRITHFVAVKEDVTDKKQAEDLLIEKIVLRERLAKVAENAPGIIYSFCLRVDGSSYFPYVSPMMEEFCGLRAQDLVENALPLYGLISPEDCLRLEKSVAESARSLTPWHFEYRIHHPTRGWLWVDSRSRPERQKDGSIVWHGFMSDVTGRKRADELLRESEEKFQQLTKHITDAFWMSSLDFKILHYVSPGYEPIWGRSLESLYSDPFQWGEAIIPEDRERVFAVFDKLTKDEAQVSAEYQIIRPDGTRRWIHDRGFQVRDAEGQLIRFTGIARDITERKLAAQQINELKLNEERSRRALEHERELHQIKSRFVSMVSHEFRTPLCIIGTAGTLLGKYAERMTVEDRARQLECIQNAVERMTGMMEDLLLHGKFESGKMECHPSQIDMRMFCQRLIAEITNHAPLAPRIEYVIDPSALETFLDINILRHVLTNLLSNAVKYSGDGYPVTMEIKRVFASDLAGKRPLEDQIEIKISDSGIGIPEADLSKLFQTFMRASNVGNRPGTGMGLAIVKQFVDLHRGTICVQSTEGKGTTVWLRLPTGLPCPSAATT